MEKHRLHIGCGLVTPPGWVHIDGSWNARLSRIPGFRQSLRLLGLLPKNQADLEWNESIRYHNVTRRLPYDDNSIEAIYTSHLIEHLHLDEQKFFLKECHRVLQPGGILRAVVPDLRSIVQEYLGESRIGSAAEAKTNADRFMMRLSVREPNPTSKPLFQRLWHRWNDLHSHKWMYDSESLIHYFTEAGFLKVEQLPLHASRIADISSIEVQSRVECGEGICIEGIK